MRDFLIFIINPLKSVKFFTNSLAAPPSEPLSSRAAKIPVDGTAALGRAPLGLRGERKPVKNV
jgi:hypothetical protein